MREFVPQHFLDSLNDLTNVEWRGYYDVTYYGIPLFLIWVAALSALLL